MTEPTNLEKALAAIDDLWHARPIARVNDHEISLAKVAGSHVWHRHPDTDECFLVLAGTLQLALEDTTVTVPAGHVFVVPAGASHCPSAPDGASILMIEIPT
jgi:mannose-6-phosphate isomerase-like protein (cupin superfamily)